MPLADKMTMVALSGLKSLRIKASTLSDFDFAWGVFFSAQVIYI